MLNVKVALPGVHMAGSDAHYNAHIDVGQHDFALFIGPDAEYPALDIDGTSERLMSSYVVSKPLSRPGVPRTPRQTGRRRQSRNVRFQEPIRQFDEIKSRLELGPHSRHSLEAKSHGYQTVTRSHHCSAP